MRWGRISRVGFRGQKRVSEGCFRFFPWGLWVGLESIGGCFGAIWARFVSFWWILCGGWCMALKKLVSGAISARRFERQKRAFGRFF